MKEYIIILKSGDKIRATKGQVDEIITTIENGNYKRIIFQSTGILGGPSMVILIENIETIIHKDDLIEPLNTGFSWPWPYYPDTPEQPYYTHTTSDPIYYSSIKEEPSIMINKEATKEYFNKLTFNIVGKIEQWEEVSLNEIREYNELRKEANEIKKSNV